jgi:hypothetical protein
VIIVAIYDVKGEWKVQQGPIRIVFNIQQTGEKLIGTAKYFRENGTMSGTLSGSTNENQFLVTVDWADGSDGVYSGTFNIEGRITGLTYNKNRPEVQATWISLGDPFILKQL